MSSPSTKTVGISVDAHDSTAAYAYDAGVIIDPSDAFLVAALVRFNGVPLVVGQPSVSVIASQADQNVGWQLDVTFGTVDVGTDTGGYYQLAFGVGDGTTTASATMLIPVNSVMGQWCIVYGSWNPTTGTIAVGCNGTIFPSQPGGGFGPLVNSFSTFYAMNLPSVPAPCAKNILSIGSLGVLTYSAATSDEDTAAFIAGMVSETMDFHFALRGFGAQYAPQTANIFAQGFTYQWNFGADSVTDAPATVSNRGAGSSIATLTRSGDAADFVRSVSDVQYGSPSPLLYIPAEVIP